MYTYALAGRALWGLGMTEHDMIFAGFVLFSLAVFIYIGKRGAGV